MDLDIAVEARPEQHYVGYPVSARLSEFGVVNALVPRIFGWLAEHQVEPASGPMYLYHRVGPVTEPIDLTVSVPVAAPVQVSGGLLAGSLRAGDYVVGRYVGRPDQIGSAQRAVEEWAAVNGHPLAVIYDGEVGVWTGRADVFLTNPDDEPDQRRWVTDLLYLTT